MITYRKAVEADLQSIINLINDDILGSTREDVKNIEPYLKAFKEIDSSHDNYLMVMLEDNLVIGTFQITITPYLPLQGKKRATIESVHIDSALRGKGYGSQMMKYAIQTAKEKGAKIIQLTTNKKRVDAKRFYEKLGFAASHEGMKFDLG